MSPGISVFEVSRTVSTISPSSGELLAPAAGELARVEKQLMKHLLGALDFFQPFAGNHSEAFLAGQIFFHRRYFFDLFGDLYFFAVKQFI